MIRMFSSTKQGLAKAQNKLRNIPENLYLEYIKDFKSLSPDNKEFLFHRMYPIFSCCFTSFSYEEYIDYFSGIVGPFKKLLMLKEKRFNTDVGYTFFTCDEFYYKDEDNSKQNMYLSNSFIIALLPHYRGSGVGKGLQDSCEAVIRSEFPNTNRVSFNTTLNAGLYEYRSQISPYVFPGPEKMPNDEVEKMLKKMMKKYDLEGISEEKPFVVNMPATINGVDANRYKSNYKNLSKPFQYFIDQTGLESDKFLANLVIYYLVEGNTLGLPPGIHEEIKPIPYEIREFKKI